MSAQMPPEFIEHNEVAHMLVGDTRYVVPWAVAVDEDWGVWLDVSHRVSVRSGGSVTLPVTRRADGFAIAPLAGHSWEPRELSTAGDWVPVAEVVVAVRETGR